MGNELVSQTVIERMLILDQSTKTEEESAQLVALSTSIWGQLDEGENFYQAARMAAIWSFKNGHVKVGEAEVAKWQRTRINMAYPYSQTWAEFCLLHLGIDTSTASNYLNNWDVYVQELGFSFADMQRAGVQRLNVARGEVKKAIPSVPEALIQAIFGDPHVCSECGEFVEYDELPESCPKCGVKPFVPVEPSSVAKVKALVREIKGEKDKDTPPHIEGDIERDGDVYRLLLFWVDGEYRHPLPTWEVPILKHGEHCPEGGIPVAAAQEFAKIMIKQYRGSTSGGA